MKSPSFLSKLSPQAVEIFLKPGELWFGNGKNRISTVLGSCVAVTLWHPSRRLGGMCHFMLPQRHSVEGYSGTRDGRYGNEALEILVDKICATGTQPKEYETQLFGGGRMFPSTRITLPVPDQNVIAAHELAMYHGLRVTTQHMGGNGHRHVTFNVWDGNTQLKYTPLLFAPTIPVPKPKKFARQF